MDHHRLLMRLLDAHDLLTEHRALPAIAQHLLDLIFQETGFNFGCVILCPLTPGPFKLLALTGATWNTATAAFFDPNVRTSAELLEHAGLVGQTLTHQSALVMAPPPAGDLPLRQHPTTMVGIPFQLDDYTGVLALAGTPSDAPADLLDALEPAASTLARLLGAHPPPPPPRPTPPAPHQNALEEALSRSDAIIRTLPDAVISIGVEGRILSVNPATERIFGFTPQSLLGQPINVLLPAPETDVPDEMATGDAHFFGTEHALTGRRRDGSLFPMEVTIARGRFDGRPIFIWIIRDVTALRQSEMERDKFFHLTPELLSVANYEGFFLRVNEAWTHILGYSADELTSRPYLDFVHPDDQPATVGEAAHIIRTGLTDRFENRYRHKDGSWRWLQWVAVGLPEENRIFAAARDITSQRQLEAQVEITNEALRRYSAGLKRLHQLATRKHGSYQALVEDYLAAGTAFFAMDAGSVKRAQGDGCAVEAVYPTNAWPKVGTLIPAQHALCADVARTRRTVAFTSTPANLITLHHQNPYPLPATFIGTPIWVDQTIYGTLSFTSSAPRTNPFHDFEFEIIELMAEAIGRFLAYSQAEAAKRQVAQERERLVEILEASPDLVAMFAPEGNLLFLNKAGRHLLGLGPNDPIGAIQIAQHLAPECIDRFQLDTIPHARQHGFHTGEFTIRAVDGTLIPVSQTVLAHRDGDGQLSHFSIIQHDIRALNEVGRLKNEFVSTVSHELRTPLTSLRGSLGLLTAGVMGQIPDKALELLNIAQNNTERLIRLINDILDLEKIASGKMEFHIEELNLADLVTTTIADLDGAATIARVRIDNRVGPHRLLADHDRLLQVFTNLIGNAIKFSPPETTIRIGALPRPGGTLRIEIADQGPGVPHDSRERIFDKFQQVDGTDARKKGGTGLGLAICKAIVEGHDGLIGVTDNDPNGAIFYVELPVARPTDRLTAISRNTHLVLLVEDDPGLCDVMWEMLQREHLLVATARSLKTARELLSRSRPALVLLDIELLDGNGLGLLEDLAAAERPRVLVVSSHDPPPTLQELAIEGWITKPFTRSHLIEQVRRALG